VGKVVVLGDAVVLLLNSLMVIVDRVLAGDGVVTVSTVEDFAEVNENADD